MPWKKGESGNPSGRAKVVIDVQNFARKRTQENLKILAYWAGQKNEPAVAVKAAIALHEIAWGKPVQAVNNKIEGALKHAVDDSVVSLLAEIRQKRSITGTSATGTSLSPQTGGKAAAQ